MKKKEVKNLILFIVYYLIIYKANQVLPSFFTCSAFLAANSGSK